MAATAKWYGLALRDIFGATATDRFDFVNDTIKASLHTNAYAYNQDTDQYFSTPTNELATAGGYTAGGQALTGKTLTYDGPTNTVRLKASDLVWAASTWTARVAVYRKDTGVAATSHLIVFTDFGADQSPAGVTFTIQHDTTDGVCRIVVT